MESMVIDRDFWRGRRVFITGHTGFKGAWLCELLVELGARITGYALRPPTNPALFDQLDLTRRIDKDIQADIRDLDLIRAAIAQSDAEIVFHMAAQSLVLRSYREPVETFSTNIMGTVNLLEAVRLSEKPKAVVLVTSDKCYEDREQWCAYRENDALGGRDPYSSSKAAAELVAAAYRRSYFVPAKADKAGSIATARAGNVIGGGDYSDNRLMPDAIRAFTKNERLKVRSPDAVRPWQHVLEPLRGYLILAQKLTADAASYADSWNFGPNDTDICSVREFLGMLSSQYPYRFEWVLDSAGYAKEASFLKLDCAKARQELGWRPLTNLDTGLRLTIDWYLRVKDGHSPADVTKHQIIQFLGLTGE